MNPIIKKGYWIIQEIKMIKKKQLAISISILGGIILLWYVIFLYPLINADRIYVYGLFEEYKSYFDDLKNDLFDLIEDYEEEKSISLYSNGKTWVIYRGESSNYTYLDENIVKKIRIFGDSSEWDYLDKIVVYRNQISFSFETNRYAIIYRSDNTKPLFMNYCDESFDVVVKKIKKNWYYCEGK